jgi:cobalt-zinc-cadmium efflux system outer membrane protein
VEKSPLGSDIEVERPPAEAGKAHRLGDENPEGVLTLRRAVVLALRQSPALAAYATEVRAREAKILQASLIPNPAIDVDVENFLGTDNFGGVRELEATAWLSQVVELGGKRSARIAAARAERKNAGWSYELARIRTLTAVASAFFDVLCAQRCLDYAKRQVSLADTVVKVFQEKVEAGKISPLKVNRAQVTLSLARIAMENNRTELARARRALAAHWGAKKPRFKKAAGKLEPVGPVPSLASLLEKLSETPHLAKWAAMIASRRARVELAESRAVPNLTVRAGYRYLNPGRDSMLVMGFSIPLPIFDRNQGAVREARHRVQKAAKEMEATRLRLLTELSTAHAELSKAHREATVLKGEVLATARETFEKVREGYRLGKFGYLEVLDAQRTLFETRRRYLEALARYKKAVTRLEGVLGAPLSGRPPRTRRRDEPAPRRRRDEPAHRESP